jgi:Zn-dependent protease with chaperone function
MNITATRFATKARTWLLIAGLTGLLIAIGLVIGGGALYIFVALAVLMNVVGYWFSDKIALKASPSSRARCPSSKASCRTSPNGHACPFRGST